MALRKAVTAADIDPNTGLIDGWYRPTSWAQSNGLMDLEKALGELQWGMSSSLPEQYQNFLNYQAGGANPFEQWNNFVRSAQDRASGDGGFMGTGISTGIPALDNVGSALFVNPVGGVTGYNAATGGDIQQGLMMDLSGLAAGYGIAGLGAPASAAAGGTASGSGAAAAGGGQGFLGSGITQGAGGATGLTQGAAGATGISGSYAAGTPLAQGFFAMEAPLALGGGVGGALGAGATTGTATQGGLYSGSAPTAGTGTTTATGAGDMFGSGAVYDAGAAALTVAPAATMPAFLTNPMVLGAAGGALLGSGLLGGGTEAKTVETEEGLPDWLVPYARQNLDRYTTELQNYQVDPYGVMPAAMQQFKDTVSGMYLDPATNKYLNDYYKLGAERIRTNLSPSFGHMQAFGQHSGYNEALARGLGDLATGLYGGAYNKERDRQAELTAMSPSFLGQASTAQFAPYQQYLSTISSLGKKKEQPYFENPMGNMIGGGMLGYGIGKLFT